MTITAERDPDVEARGVRYRHPLFGWITLLYVICPHCGRTHCHGDGGTGSLGHRVSDCFKGNGYFITAVTPDAG